MGGRKKINGVPFELCVFLFAFFPLKNLDSSESISWVSTSRLPSPRGGWWVLPGPRSLATSPRHGSPGGLRGGSGWRRKRRFCAPFGRTDMVTAMNGFPGSHKMLIPGPYSPEGLIQCLWGTPWALGFLKVPPAVHSLSALDMFSQPCLSKSVFHGDTAVRICLTLPGFRMVNVMCIYYS